MSTYADIAGMFDSSDHAKAARAAFEKAIELEPNAMKGAALINLGVLYFEIPG